MAISNRYNWPLFATAVFLVCQKISTEATPTAGANVLTQVCGEVCEYDSWYERADCTSLNLRRVPKPIGCNSVVVMELQDNHIVELRGDSLSGYDLLKTLDLSQNRLQVLEPGTFAFTQKIENIFLSDNRLGNVQNGTFNGAEINLKRLYLDNNRLVNLKETAFTGLMKLQTLELNENQLQSLPDLLFSGLQSLQHLRLDMNELKYLDAGTFGGLSNLENLNLKRNKLSSIPVGIFGGLSSLRVVDLSHNSITTLLGPSELNLPVTITCLDISDNELNQSTIVLQFLQTTEQVFFGNNPFECDCDFIEVQRWYLNQTKDEQQKMIAIGDISCTTNNGTHISIAGDTSFICRKEMVESTTFRTSAGVMATTRNERPAGNQYNSTSTVIAPKGTESTTSATHMHDVEQGAVSSSAERGLFWKAALVCNVFLSCIILVCISIVILLFCYRSKPSTTRLTLTPRNLKKIVDEIKKGLKPKALFPPNNNRVPDETSDDDEDMEVRPLPV